MLIIPGLGVRIPLGPPEKPQVRHLKCLASFFLLVILMNSFLIALSIAAIAKTFLHHRCNPMGVNSTITIVTMSLPQEHVHKCDNGKNVNMD